MYAKAYASLDNILKKSLEHHDKSYLEKMNSKEKIYSACSEILDSNNSFKESFLNLTGIKDDKIKLVNLLSEVISSMYSYLKLSLFNGKCEEFFEFDKDSLEKCVNDHLLRL